MPQQPERARAKARRSTRTRTRTKLRHKRHSKSSCLEVLFTYCASRGVPSLPGLSLSLFHVVFLSLSLPSLWLWIRFEEESQCVDCLCFVQVLLPCEEDQPRQGREEMQDHGERERAFREPQRSQPPPRGRLLRLLRPRSQLRSDHPRCCCCCYCSPSPS